MKQLVILLLLFIIVSCQEEVNDSTSNSNVIEASVEQEEIIPFEQYDTLQGIFIGDFAGSPIRVVLNYVSDKKVVGYDIHKGLQRNISGDVRTYNDSIVLTLKEPGDGPYDGVFYLNVDRSTLNIKGKWVPNSEELNTKGFSLKRYVSDRTWQDNPTISMENFPSYFSHTSYDDTDIYFQEDGLVKCNYFELTDVLTEKEEFKQFFGGWYIKNQKLHIDWQENPLFPKHQVYDINLDYFSITSDSLEFHSMIGVG